MRSLFALAIIATSTPAVAEPDEGITTNESVTRSLASDSAFTPGMFRADNDGKGFFVASTTIDNARDNRVSVAAHAEANIIGPARLVLTVQDAFRDKPKPG